MTLAAACPGCGSTQHDTIDRVRLQRIVDGWREPHLQIEVAGLFPPGLEALEQQRCRHCDLQWFEPRVAGDAEFYGQLQRHDWYYEADKPEFTQAAALIGNAASVLEVGCGAGNLARHLPAGLRYRGLEFNAQAVARAQAAGRDVVCRSVQDEALAAPQAYDVVCHFQVLEHVAEPQAFMQACVAALRPGGLLLVAVPADDSFVGSARNAWLNLPPHHLTRWSDRALTTLFDSVDAGPATLWHEPVSAVHRAWRADTLARWAWSHLIRQTVRASGVMTDGALERLLWRLPSVRLALRRWGDRQHPWGAAGERGHTVLAWGRRRA